MAASNYRPSPMVVYVPNGFFNDALTETEEIPTAHGLHAMSMFHARDGLYFEQQPDGGVRVFKYADPAAECPVIMCDVTVDRHVWASIIASMSYYGEEDYGFYRATNFHSKEPIPESAPLKDKPPIW